MPIVLSLSLSLSRTPCSFRWGYLECFHGYYLWCNRVDFSLEIGDFTFCVPTARVSLWETMWVKESHPLGLDFASKSYVLKVAPLPWCLIFHCRRTFTAHFHLILLLNVNRHLLPCICMHAWRRSLPLFQYYPLSHLATLSSVERGLYPLGSELTFGVCLLEEI